MKNFQQIHTMAMDFFDLSKIEKVKGNETTSNYYLKNAFLLEKDAALATPDCGKAQVWRYIYLRSAGWMAFNLGEYEEARKLTLLGLEGTPDGRVHAQLEELLKQIEAKNKNLKATKKEQNGTNISGYFASVDLLEGEIRVQENGSKSYQIKVEMPNRIADITRTFLGDTVVVQIKKDVQNNVILQDIWRAA